MNTDYQLWLCIGTVEELQALKYTPSGLAILEFRLASTYVSEWDGGKREEGCSAPCVLFGKKAEAMKTLLPGARVLIHGRWKEQKWEDKQTGKPRSRHTVSVQEIVVLTGMSSVSTTTHEQEGDDSSLPF